MVVFFDPIQDIVTAFRNLYGDELRILISYDVDLKKRLFWGKVGATIFPDEGNFDCLIFVSPHIKILNAVEILAHELAYVVSGYENKHNDAWNKVFTAIREEYDKINFKRLEEVR